MNVINEIKKLFEKYFKENIEEIKKLPASGSAREYYEVKSLNKTVIGTYNSDVKENIAFIEFSKIFKQNGINVPEIYAVNENQTVYLQEYLGNETLYDRIKKTGKISDKLIEIYKKVINQLVDIQINTKDKTDYSLCIPRSDFDRQSIMWDLNYFKYQFLKYTDIIFDEQLLENDFNTFADFLTKTDCGFFLYRDFQSRNIMLKGDDVYFIDYQGGRRGALQYDIASLLYDAKAGLSEEIREYLLDYYIKTAKKLIKINENEFKEFYYAYALIRIMQAFGAYGYRGLYEKKRHFIESIKPGLKNLTVISRKAKILDELPEIKRIINILPESEKLKKIISENKLTVRIKSFSYKRGIPYDKTGNGGGFVFDCRFIENPGRTEKYKNMCGKDAEVIKFLDALPETGIFFDSVKKIISASVENYLQRGFTDLTVNFGCTGGQHRSVYFAEKTASFLKENFDINIETVHTEGF